MKNSIFIKFVILVGSALFTGFSFAGEASPKSPISPSSDLAVDFEVGYTTEYVWRGINRGDDLFEASIGASGNGSIEGLGDINLSAGLWIGTFSGEVDTSSYGVARYGPVFETRSAQELRINMEASKSLGCFDLAVGVTNYSFFGSHAGVDDVLEPYLALSTEMAGLDIGIGFYDDHNDTSRFGGDDPYTEITAGRSVDLGGLGLSVQGVIGTWDNFDNVYYGLSVGLPIAASDSITVTPHASAVFGDTFEDDDEFTAGVTLGFGF
ncbi:MAG: hypothetical protein MK194_16630 [Roseibacillus sp.]|nr:hypothetical protein [Roseibacillus sp.]